MERLGDDKNLKFRPPKWAEKEDHGERAGHVTWAVWLLSVSRYG